MRHAPRKHQQEVIDIAKKIEASDYPKKILAHVVPAGGKSMLPGLVADEHPKLKIGWFVPRLSLRDQAVRGLWEDFGIEVRDSILASVTAVP